MDTVLFRFPSDIRKTGRKEKVIRFCPYWFVRCGEKGAGVLVLAIEKTPGMMGIRFLFRLTECFCLEYRRSGVRRGILQSVLAGGKAAAGHLEHHVGIPQEGICEGNTAR